MAVFHAGDREAFSEALAQLQAGDCIEAESLAAIVRNAREFVAALTEIADKAAQFASQAEGIDTREAQGAAVVSLCRSLDALEKADRRDKQREGIERAKGEGKYLGRKPIAVDDTLFEAVVQRWEQGEMSAREAMAELKLKPNTFYRRIKQREEQKMNEHRKVAHEIRAEIKEAARQSRRDLDELKKQVKAEAREVKKAASETLELHDVERELRRERRRAENEHEEAVRQMKREVEAETKEFKQVLEEK